MKKEEVMLIQNFQAKFFTLLKIVVLICLFYNVFTVSFAEAKKSSIKGDPPKLVWTSPLGDKNIENNDYNRCRFIKKFLTGSSNGDEANRNYYEIMSDYVANLYAHSIKTPANISEEKEAKPNTLGDESSEKSIIDTGIIPKLSNIARRMNIIVSLEAETAMVKNIMEFQKLELNIYKEFRALKDGKYEFTDDCSVLKK